jgi:hypothetical protein
MTNFYDNLAREDVEVLERLARLLLELRESRTAVLARHAAGDEDALLAAIRAGAVPEHPGYEDYLGARAIGAALAALRADLRQRLLEVRRP